MIVAPAIPPSQETVAVVAAHVARARPARGSRAVVRVTARRPITEARTVLPVLAHAVDARGAPWLRVRLPGRTLGAPATARTGWIVAARTRPGRTGWHVVVDVDARRVSAYRAGRRVRHWTATVGDRATPTPRGAYFVEENVRLDGGRTAGPFALATSARSAVLQEFASGPGQIALHGRDGIGGPLGVAASHGCVRLSDGAVRWLAGRLPPGVPVTIR
ncbi:L,D-transpeptidase [Patulibacter americanus]|uniref:L,D-transpeptidase n=1 Tax=Patulibacter americanus TaxID=588672 RepID=UPI0003FD0563|nr:L,D-transpeptidase [Patulibacter americanus]